MNCQIINCHGCKWLDEVGHKGAGYCAMVKRSRNYHDGDRVRNMYSKRCDLYEAGDFKTRFGEGNK